MSLWRMHRILIGSAIGLCLIYAVHEARHAKGRSASRVAVGVGAPLALAGALGAYLRHLLRARP